MANEVAFESRFRHFIMPWARSDWPRRSTLDLLERPFTFSQDGILSPSEFTRLAESRGISINEGQLEQLHRRRVLIPFFQVLSRRGAANTRSFDPTPPAPPGSNGWRLLESAREGVLVDPVDRRFLPWPRGRYGSSIFYYAPFQVVGLHELRPIFALIESSWHDGARSYELETIDADTRRKVRHARDLTIALEALASVFLPDIRRQVSGSTNGTIEEWFVFRDQHDPAEVLRFLGVAPDLLVSQGDELLFRAQAFDPLDGWIKLIRNANQNAWNALKGEARLALDYRLAAELLLRLHDGLAAAGHVPSPDLLPEMARHQRRGRLLSEPGELDEILSDFGLSPHAAVVVAVEGATEAILFPRILECAGVVPRAGFADVVELKGGGNDAGVIARHVVPPRMGHERGDYAVLQRPLTHAAIVVDPDSRWAEPGARDMIVDSILSCLEARFRTERMRSQLDQLVTIHTWSRSRGPFEFANFTDDELAEGVLSSSDSIHGSRDRLVRAIRAQRSSPHPDIERACKRIARGLTKPRLAEALWPTLEPKLGAAFDGDDDEPPIAKIAHEVIRAGLAARRANAVEL